MEPRCLHHSRENHSARYRVAGLIDEEGCTNLASETKTTRRSSSGLLSAELQSAPWFGWLFVYTFTLFCFSASRWLALRELVMMYSSSKDYTMSVKLAALGLGFVEDFVCTTYFACAL
ncbi:hypothetical protein PR001_g30566, partial [Phytophthora rubi]